MDSLTTLQTAPSRPIASMDAAICGNCGTPIPASPPLGGWCDVHIDADVRRTERWEA